MAMSEVGRFLNLGSPSDFMMKWCLVLSVFLAGVALSEIYAIPIPEETEVVADVPEMDAVEEFRGLIPVENDPYDPRGRGSKRGHRRKPHNSSNERRKKPSSGGYRHGSSDVSHSSDESDHEERRRPSKKPKRPSYNRVDSESGSYESNGYDRHRPPYEICVKMPEYHREY